jgi:hypothetical protein
MNKYNHPLRRRTTSRKRLPAHAPRWAFSLMDSSLVHRDSMNSPQIRAASIVPQPSSREDHLGRASSVANTSPLPQELRWVEQLSDLLDTRFRIPGTNIRFGADFLLGLLPGAGDLISMGMSGLMIVSMARHGVSPRLVLRMLLNVGVDTLAGSIPLLGNVFDLFFKANRRNLRLLREHYALGKHSGSVWPILIGIGICFALLVAAVFALLATFIAWLL